MLINHLQIHAMLHWLFIVKPLGFPDIAEFQWTYETEYDFLYEDFIKTIALIKDH